MDRYLHHAARSFRDAGLDAEARRLETWSRRAGSESTEATLFHVWFHEVRQGLRKDLYGSPDGYFPRAAGARALDAGTVADSILTGAARTAASHGDLPWGEAHRLTLGHPLAEVPLLRILFGFGERGLERAGGPYSVNVARFSGPGPPFTVTHGPSQRHVVDLADPDGAGGFVLPGGQSGFPGNRHAFDQLELWRDGRLVGLPLARERVEAGSVVRLRLVPTPPGGG